MYREGEELGVDWKDWWEKFKEALRRARDKVPDPTKPSPPWPKRPKVPGPPGWAVAAVALYLMWLWDQPRKRRANPWR
jgi:hypothetical protein